LPQAVAPALLGRVAQNNVEMGGDDSMGGMLGVSRAMRTRTRSRPEQSML
jgi:hypothetical protein